MKRPEVTDRAQILLDELLRAVEQVKAARRMEDDEYEAQSLARLDRAWRELNRERRRDS